MKYVLDIPVGKAMLAWTPADWVNFDSAGQVMVVKHPDTYQKSRHLQGTIGACFEHWERMSSKEQLQTLVCEAWLIVLRDGISPESMHQALSVIPEYRALLGKGFELYNPWKIVPTCTSPCHSLQ